MIYLHDETLTCFDAEDLEYLSKLNKAQYLTSYHDDGIMHLETIQKLEAIAAKSAADLILEADICKEL